MVLVVLFLHDGQTTSLQKDNALLGFREGARASTPARTPPDAPYVVPPYTPLNEPTTVNITLFSWEQCRACRFAAFAVSFAYFFLGWLLWGRTPRYRTLRPRVYPPQHSGTPEARPGEPPVYLSSAAVSYIYHSGSLTAAGLTSLFLSLAMRGLCAIRREARGTYFLTPLAPDSCTGSLPAEERMAYEGLLRAVGIHGLLELSPRPDTSIALLRREIEQELHARHEKIWRHNHWINILGWTVVLPMGLIFVLAGSHTHWEWVAALASFGFVCIVLALRRDRLPNNILKAVALPLLFCLLLFVGWNLYAAGGMHSLADYKATFAHTSSGVWVAALIALPLLFTPLMRAPAKASWALLEAIHAHVAYIRLRGKKPTTLLQPSPAAWKRFKDILPYAMALGMEKTWSDAFAQLLDSGTAAHLTLEGMSDHDSLMDFLEEFQTTMSLAGGFTSLEPATLAYA